MMGFLSARKSGRPWLFGSFLSWVVWSSVFSCGLNAVLRHRVATLAIPVLDQGMSIWALIRQDRPVDVESAGRQRFLAKCAFASDPWLTLVTEQKTTRGPCVG